MGGRVLHFLVAALAVGGLAAIGADRATPGPGAAHAEGGIFRVSINAVSGIDSMDPALASSPPAGRSSTRPARDSCRIPTRPRLLGSACSPRSQPSFPSVSRDRMSFTFRLRNGFRFSDGSPGPRERVRPRDQPHARARDEIARAPVRSRHRRRRAGRRRQGVFRLRRHRAREHARRASHPSRAGLPAAGRRRLSSAPCLPRCRSMPRASAHFPRPGRTTSSNTGGASGSCCDGTGTTAERGLTMSRASTSISASRRRRRCCDVSIEARRTGATRSPGIYFDSSLGLVEKYGINRSQLLRSDPG